MGEKSKGTKMYGGLIKKKSEVIKDKRGHVTTKHFDGRVDVNIHATPLNTSIKVKNPFKE